ncbi:uncharacterized protein [Ptychodera flava]|uniref:uncharacterized protein n=1 Tax=Ptychodera flava TaxID=63121 RepID=UPI00396A8365
MWCICLTDTTKRRCHGCGKGSPRNSCLFCGRRYHSKCCLASKCFICTVTGVASDDGVAVEAVREPANVEDDTDGGVAVHVPVEAVSEPANVEDDTDGGVAVHVPVEAVSEPANVADDNDDGAAVPVEAVREAADGVNKKRKPMFEVPSLLKLGNNKKAKRYAICEEELLRRTGEPEKLCPYTLNSMLRCAKGNVTHLKRSCQHKIFQSTSSPR